MSRKHDEKNVVGVLCGSVTVTYARWLVVW